MMNDSELLANVHELIDSVEAGGYSEVSEQRAKAMEYYLGEPYGNEIEDQSQVVTSEVANAVEWIKPQLLKIFTSTNKIVEFEPTSPEDEMAAKQETAYLNHIFHKENDGFQLLYTWFNDALLQKNGVMKYFWEESEEEREEDYEGLTALQYEVLMAEDDIEVVEYEEYFYEDPQDISNIYPLYNCRIKRKIKNGKICIVNVPPEDFLVNDAHNCIDLSEADCAHKTRKTREQLLDAGVPKAQVDKINFDSEWDTTEEESRWADIDSSKSNSTLNTAIVYEVYKRIDYDGDGYAELRKVTFSGEEILFNEEVDYVPFVAITPIIMSHRFYGRSIADLVMDLQLIKSTLLRNILDNLYHINNQRSVIVDGEVNLDDLLDGAIGGVIRASQPGMVEPFPITPFSGHAFQMMEYLDALGENRSGVTRYSQGLDGDSLNKTATGVTKIMNASQERILLIARVFAEGLRRMFLGLHRVLQQNQNYYRKVKLGEHWVEINPSEWKDRAIMSINVGLGSGDKSQEIMYLTEILQLQERAAMGPLSHLVQPHHAYNTVTKMVEAAGFKDVEQFFADPATTPPPPPQPDIQQQMLQLQAQIEQQKSQIEQFEAQVKAFEAQSDAQYKQDMVRLKEAEITGNFVKARNEEELQQSRLDLSEYQTGVDAAVELEKIDATTKQQSSNQKS